MRPRNIAITIIAVVLAVPAWSAVQRLRVGFSANSLHDWHGKSFKGHTDYHVTDGPDGHYLVAHCNGDASAIYRRMDVNLKRTPVLHWQWRINHVHAGLDGRTRHGDDYSARVYVIHSGGWMIWNTRAVNYVWANTQPSGSHWPNAITGKAMMVALQSGNPAHPGQWVSESRNVRRDFRRFYGLNLKSISGVAIMTDCDNGGGESTGYYRHIYFAAH